MSAHAILSPSSAHRWLNCTPSARMEETLPNKSSVYASAGTLAHKLAELKVTKYFTKMKKSVYDKRLTEIQAHELYTKEMMGHTDAYLDYIKSIVIAYPKDQQPHVAVELNVKFGHIVPEGRGTADCVIVGGGKLHIIDFKYGEHVAVSADNNPQTMLYALGALAAYDMLYSIYEVRITIVQPRRESISEWGISTAELRNWGERLKPIAQIAFEGKGECKIGDWCGFCRAKALCPAQYDEFKAVDDMTNHAPDMLTTDDVCLVLERYQTLKSWLEAVYKYALAQTLSGAPVPGWKAVEGRSNRQWTDQNAAFTALRLNGIDESVLYERSPVSLAQIEKTVGKVAFKEMVSGFVTKVPGAPKLVPESDKNPAIVRPTAEQEFSIVEED